MNIPLFILGIIILVLTLSDTLGQGRFIARFMGKKTAMIFNTLLGIIIIILAFL